MRRRRIALAGILTAALVTTTSFSTGAWPVQAQPSEGLTGFSPEMNNWQQQFEERYSEGVRAERIKKDSRAMSQRPSQVASEGNDASLDYAVKKLKKAGLNPKVKSYDVYLSTPKKISVTQTAPEKRELQVMENLPKETPFKEEVLPGYNAYSPAGKAEAELVYANYARPEDFAELEKRGVSVEGKIVIARYGENFRGVKPDLAAQHGAVGMIIYSDPADDGYKKGKVYPDGPWRPADGIQRGSILPIYQYPGDPLTPGTPSIQGEKRLDPEEADHLPTIPTTPISYGEAKHLLKSMDGPKAPQEWQGGLPFTYHLGPGSAKAKIDLDIDYEQKPVHDVIVKIPGKTYPQQTIVIGAHRDTWGYGTQDNISGWATTMEIARVLGKMAKNGWQPERTIVLAGWDGEEYGLLGSTEWAEEKRDPLMKHAVAYLNLDGVGGKYFDASAVPSLNHLITSVTKDVTEPRNGKSIYEDWVERSDGEKPTIGQLGSGSDYTAFLQHNGVPSIDAGFSTPGGQYHSAYDNTDAMERFLDPGYQHQAAAAKVHGILALRLANADVLPLQYSAYGETVEKLLLEQVEKGASKEELKGAIEAAKAWQEAARNLEKEADSLIEDGITPEEREKLRSINRALLKQERDLMQEEGIPSRPWYKHQIWAPGLTTGYAAQPLPALTEALESGDESAVQQAADWLEASLQDAADTAQSAVR